MSSYVVNRALVNMYFATAARGRPSYGPVDRVIDERAGTHGPMILGRACGLNVRFWPEALSPLRQEPA